MGEKKSKAWTVLGAAAGLNLLTGILYIWSILSKSLINELHWSSKQASLPYTVATITLVIFMMIFGKLQDKKGPRLTATLSVLLMGSGLILSGFATKPEMMLLTFGLLTGAGIGIGVISAMPPAVKWFPPEKKGFVAGIVVAGLGLASVIFAPLTNSLLKVFGIFKVFIIIGFITLVIGLILAQLLRNPGEGFLTGYENKKENGNQEIPSLVVNLNVNDMLKTTSFYRLWLMLAFSSSAGLMIIGHLANIAQSQVRWEGGYILVVILAVFNTLGRLLGGAISDKIGTISLMKIICSLQAANMLMFSHYNSIGLLAVGAAVVGLNYGAIFSIYPAITVDFYGINNIGANYGLMFTAYGVGGVIGPMMAAAMFDATQNYSTSYLVACFLLLITVLTAFTFRYNNN